MAKLRIKRTNTAIADPKLLTGELGLIGNTVWYGPKTTDVNDDLAVSALKLAGQNIDNIFTGTNKFDIVPQIKEGTNYTDIATISKVSAATAKIDGKFRANTTFTADAGISLTKTLDSVTNPYDIKISHTNSIIPYDSSYGFLKVKYDAQGHITSTTSVVKEDITGLKIPAQDTYVDGFTITGGTTAGPTINLTQNGIGADYNVPIPSASDTVSGVVTTGIQTFGGDKAFNNSVTIKGDLTVTGTTTTVDTQTLKVKDNLIVTNTGAPAKEPIEPTEPINLSGLAIRVSQAKTDNAYGFVYNNKEMQIGKGTLDVDNKNFNATAGQLQSVATRTMNNVNSMSYWNAAEKTFKPLSVTSPLIFSVNTLSLGQITATNLGPNLIIGDTDKGIIVSGGTGNQYNVSANYATTTAPGVIKVGANLNIAADGTLNGIVQEAASNKIPINKEKWIATTGTETLRGAFKYEVPFSSLNYNDINYAVEVLETLVDSNGKETNEWVEAPATVVKNNLNKTLTIYSETNTWGGYVIATSGGKNDSKQSGHKIASSGTLLVDTPKLNFRDGFTAVNTENNSQTDIDVVIGTTQSGSGNVVTGMSYTPGTLTYTKGITALTRHQDIKTLNTTNTEAQAVDGSETISGSGILKLHRISKTGNYNDLLNKPAIPSIPTHRNLILKTSVTAATDNTFTTTYDPVGTADTTITINKMSGATATNNGFMGLVPQPLIANKDHYLRGDGTWSTPTDTNYVTGLYVGDSSATASAAATINGNTYLKLFDDNILRQKINIYGTGATRVTSTTANSIIINSTDTTYTAGTGLSFGSPTEQDPTAGTRFNLDVAKSTELGGISIGYTTSGRNYALTLDANNKAYVNVLWTDTYLTTGGSDSDQVATANTSTAVTYSNITGRTLAGYTKGTSAASIIVTDTLSAALGKLENQIDTKQATLATGTFTSASAGITLSDTTRKVIGGGLTVTLNAATSSRLGGIKAGLNNGTTSSFNDAGFIDVMLDCGSWV